MYRLFFLRGALPGGAAKSPTCAQDDTHPPQRGGQQPGVRLFLLKSPCVPVSEGLFRALVRLFQDRHEQLGITKFKNIGGMGYQIQFKFEVDLGIHRSHRGRMETFLVSFFESVLF